MVSSGTQSERERLYSDRGHECERVAKRHFESQGHFVVATHLPLVFAEVDLVLVTPDKEIWLIEVKSVFNRDLIFSPPIKSKQKTRLRRALARWMGSIQHPVRLHLAAVNHQDEVTMFYDLLAQE